MEHSADRSVQGLGFRPKEWGLLFFLLLIRLLCMYSVPLNDSTEARYGEIARKMLATGDWITLWHDFGIPFWGKPPFSIWLSAFSMKLFSVTAFSARLPSMLLSVGVLVMVSQIAAQYRSVAVGRVSFIVLASSFIFYLASGTVMMDPALAFAVVLCQISFWRALQTPFLRDGYLFFLGLSIGLLAKGPVVLILVGGSIGSWIIWKNQWRALWQSLPWFSGTFLMLALVLPWYIGAEYKTPGFLNYFIVGEHFGRFFQPAWQGDKYGFAHVQSFGMIWPYFIMGTLPWSVLMLNCCGAKARRAIVSCFKQDSSGWLSYWSVCCLFPLVFFSFAKNLIYPYVLPAIPAFALLFADCWVRSRGKDTYKLLLSIASLMGIGFLVGMMLFEFKPGWVNKSQNRVIALWLKQPDATQNPLVFYDKTVDFSAQFYTKAHTFASTEPAEICQRLNPSMPVYVVVDKRRLTDFQQKFKLPYTQIGREKIMSRVEYLLKVERLGC